jgi:hypothetical protein
MQVPRCCANVLLDISGAGIMRASSIIQEARSLYGEAFAQEFSQVGRSRGGSRISLEPGPGVG